MMEERIIERLRKVLNLTTSPVEGEAQAAADMLAKLLTEHNLNIVDLEQKGQAAPGIQENGYDLGKAAFQWKLDLAEAVAEHYYCHGLVNRTAKTVVFVGRPDNVESLQMLYAWIINQIKRIASDERRTYIGATGEHIDPLRWQVNFGIGAVSRLGTRLRELKEEREHEDAEGSTHALVISRAREVSDYLEEKYGYRADGRRTKKEEESEREWEEWRRRQQEEEAIREELRELDPDEFYRLYPYETLEAKAKQAAENEKYWRKEKARQRRNAQRRTGAGYSIPSEKETARRKQAREASDAGYSAADRVNLKPFLEEGESTRDQKKVGG